MISFSSSFCNNTISRNYTANGDYFSSFFSLFYDVTGGEIHPLHYLISKLWITTHFRWEKVAAKNNNNGDPAADQI